MTAESQRILLDLSRYADREQALVLAVHGCPTAYTEVAKKHMMGHEDLTMAFMLFGSFVSRMRGLHEGVVRELMNDNPHAVLPLIRVWVETLTTGLYTLRNPGYVEQLLHGPGKNRPHGRALRQCFMPSVMTPRNSSSFIATSLTTASTSESRNVGAPFPVWRTRGQVSPSLSARLAASILLGVPVLRSTFVTWTLTVLSLMNRSRAISALVRPAARWLSTSRSRVVSVAKTECCPDDSGRPLGSARLIRATRAKDSVSATRGAAPICMAME